MASNIAIVTNRHRRRPARPIDPVPMSPIDFVLDGRYVHVWADQGAFSNSDWSMRAVLQVAVAMYESRRRDVDVDAVVKVERTLDERRLTELVIEVSSTDETAGYERQPRVVVKCCVICRHTHGMLDFSPAMTRSVVVS